MYMMYRLIVELYQVDLLYGNDSQMVHNPASQIKLTAAAFSAATAEFVSFVKRHLQSFPPPLFLTLPTLSLSDFG